MRLQTAKGTRDIPPGEEIPRKRIIKVVTAVFESYGFNPLDTPVLERYETLSAKYAGGSEILKETFKLKDQGDRELGLRYDLTVPLARFVGINPTLKFPFKRYQLGRVFRDGPIKLGRYREFWQLDADIVGCNNIKADTELIAMTEEIFNKLGINIIININNRKVLDRILEYAGIKQEKVFDAIIALDKLDKIGEAEVLKEMAQKGISDEQTAKLMSVIKVKGTDEEKIAFLETILKGNEGVNELKEMFKAFKSLELKNVRLELSLARGLAYYTGPIFEVFAKDSEIKSSIAAGGRYDKMISQFLNSNKQFPATGISFGLDVLLDSIKLSKTETEKTLTQVLIIPIKTYKESLKIASELREKGINTEIDIMDRGLSNNLNYANSMEIPFAIIIGEKELKQKKLNLKNMRSGREELLTLNEVVKRLK